MPDHIYRTMSEAWHQELALTVRQGDVFSPRGMATHERMFAEFEVVQPLTFPVASSNRDFRDAIPVLEALSMIAQTSLPLTFTDRIRKFGDFTDDGVFWGSYGARLHGQVGDLVTLLKSDPDSRQAVLTIFDAGRDLAAAKKDKPCTVSIQFMLRYEELNMKVNMRSNDMWLGTPYDLTQFAILQATLAQVLGVTPGTYVHSAGSLHVYDRDMAKIDKVLSADAARGGLMSFPLWNAGSLAEIVERAQRILLGDGEMLKSATRFELWAAASLA